MLTRLRIEMCFALSLWVRGNVQRLPLLRLRLLHLLFLLHHLRPLLQARNPRITLLGSLSE
jgi:hypothetical protein